ncbi:Uncharacterised protein [Candidatus Tiddalikarchaeum anstoanum]|nr:Uncharacterised protein [Candidatus Tiddalikarchaeum anstoanum]
MNLSYLKMSKEEIDLAYNLLDGLNDNNILPLIQHLLKSMGFMTDYLNDGHVDLTFELPKVKGLLDEKLDKDFLEIYYYLDTLSRKEFHIFDNTHIVISGRNIEKVDKGFFSDLTYKIAEYFNTVYELTENSAIWN